MAVDFEMLRQRKLFISDISTAFSDPSKGVRQLEKQEQQLSLVYRRSQSTTTAINWDFPSDSAERMKIWGRNYVFLNLLSGILYLFLTFILVYSKPIYANFA